MEPTYILFAFSCIFLSSQILQKFSEKFQIQKALVAAVSAGLLNDGPRKRKKKTI